MKHKKFKNESNENYTDKYKSHSKKSKDFTQKKMDKYSLKSIMYNDYSEDEEY